MQSVFNALSRGSLIRIGPIRIIQTCVITGKIFMKAFKFFGPIQWFWLRLVWVAVLLGLFFVVDAGNAVQQPLIKKSCHHAGLNCGPCACKAHVITTTPWWHCGWLVVLVRLSSVHWLCNMLVVDVKAVSSNGLLETTLVPNIYTRLDYQAVLVKGSHYPVGIGILSFWFIFVVLRLQFSLLDFVC